MGQFEEKGFAIKEDGTIVRNSSKVDNFKKKIVERGMEPENRNSAGLAELIISFLFPIIGVICYFFRRNKVDNAKAYLYSALGGFIFSLILNLIFNS